jgi:hypothetical protein
MKPTRPFCIRASEKTTFQYLGPDPSIDVDGLNGADDVDDLNTIANIEWAFNTWAVSQSPHDILCLPGGAWFHRVLQTQLQNRMLAR